ITLHIKSDADEFLDPWRLQAIIRKWSDHIAWPVTIMRDGKEEAANEGTALWRKSRNDVTEEQLEEFYRHISHNFDKPWDTLHWRAEGMMEFSALLFIPSSRPFEFGEQTRESKVRLHVRRMFITDDAEILPPWLRFVHGVVDTEDLPLNVSREMLQATPVLARIRKAVTTKVVNELKTRAKDAQAYATFWDNFGPVLKEGMWDDPTYKTDVAALSRFRSSAVDTLTSLDDYISRMKPEQDAIYYVTGDNADVLNASPQIEGFKARGVEVLLLSDPVDSFWPERLGTYEGKSLRNVAQGLNDLEKFGAPEASTAEKADMDTLLPALKTALGDAVSDIRATDRLVSSAMVLSAPEGGPDLQLRKLMQRSGQDIPDVTPVLELNPAHPMIHSLAQKVQAGDKIDTLAHILLDVASIQNGETPKDVNAFSRRIMDYLTGGTQNANT
ncbi:MAG: molecular chaperone HtpG, partial [Acetobacter lovaniensis]|nr:molecular chaperone HtpG [Acetobacter lovaniensis]